MAFVSSYECCAFGGFGGLSLLVITFACVPYVIPQDLFEKDNHHCKLHAGPRALGHLQAKRLVILTPLTKMVYGPNEVFDGLAALGSIGSTEPWRPPSFSVAFCLA